MYFVTRSFKHIYFLFTFSENIADQDLSGDRDTRMKHGACDEFPNETEKDIFLSLYSEKLDVCSRIIRF